MSNIYGGITYPGSPFIFDKVYDNLQDAQDSAQHDGVLLGRYILIKYCETAFDQDTRTNIEQENVILADEAKIYYDNYAKDKEQYLISKDRVVCRKEWAPTNDRFVYNEIANLHATGPSNATMEQVQELLNAINNTFNTNSADAVATLKSALVGKPIGDDGAEVFNDYRPFADPSEANDHEGAGNQATGLYAHVEGSYNQAMKKYSHAEGHGTLANGSQSHAEGRNTTASGNAAHAEGLQTQALGTQAHAEGRETIASGTYGAHAEGYLTQALSRYSHAEGRSTIAGEFNDADEGGLCAHAEGNGTKALGNNSHAEGNKTLAQGSSAHAEGRGSEALATESHAEGTVTHATALGAHAEGEQTWATGDYAHAEGSMTTASGNHAHVGGRHSSATGTNSFAHGLYVEAQNPNQFVVGQYSEHSTVAYDNAIFVVGTGTTRAADDLILPKNGFMVMKDGSAQVVTQGTNSNSIVQYATLQNNLIVKLEPISANAQGLLQVNADCVQSIENNSQSYYQGKAEPLNTFSISLPLTIAYKDVQVQRGMSQYIKGAPLLKLNSNIVNLGVQNSYISRGYGYVTITSESGNSSIVLPTTFSIDNNNVLHWFNGAAGYLTEMVILELEIRYIAK